MCMLCGKSYTVDIMVIDKNSTRTFCPNCLTVATLNNTLMFENNKNIKDDITGEYGAILYIADREQYSVNRDTLRRLILCNLTPKEWNILNDKYVKPHNTFRFLLHEDFYDDDGIALQSMDREDN